MLSMRWTGKEILLVLYGMQMSIFNEMGFTNWAETWYSPSDDALSFPVNVSRMASYQYHIRTWGKSLVSDGDSRFNPRNIILDSRQANFMVIIDRETGKIVWRIGPDYSKDTEVGQKLGQIIGMHNAHMIPQGLPGEGISLSLDNGGYAGYGSFRIPARYLRFYSRVIEFNPITYDIIWEYEKKDGPLFPRYAEGHRIL